MWYFFAGNFMSAMCYFALYKGALNPTDLTALDRLFGWFLLEHLFEDYRATAGKFFLNNIDFRTLVKNFLIVVRNIIVWSHFITFSEFLLTGSTLLLLSYFLYCSIKPKNLCTNKTTITIFTYYTLIFYFLFLKIIKTFNLFDLCLIFKPISLLVSVFAAIHVTFKIFLSIFPNLFTKIFKLSNQIVALKAMYLLLFLTFLYLWAFKSLLCLSYLNDNFFQEFLTKIVAVYFYFYYST